MRQRLSPSSFVVNGNRLLRLYSGYSLLLALLLLLTTVLDADNVIFGGQQPLLMLSSAAIYVLLAAFFAGLAGFKPDAQLATGYIFIEVVILTTMMYATGGLATGFPSLIAIAVVISNLLNPGLLGYGVAAWTTLAMLYTQILMPEDYDSQTTFTVGLYGFLCFILSWITQSLSRRLNSALSLADQQAMRIQRLQQLSQQALQSLDSGVVACNLQGKVLFINETAQHWLQLQEGDAVPIPLTAHSRASVLSLANQQLIIKKMALHGAHYGDYLVSLEDSAQLAAQAQQLKLASLGRLTASIAHEVRNPLSALKQAAQLLGEAGYLQQGEQQLTQIIDQQCDRINQVIENVLQLSRRKQAQAESFELQPWLQIFEKEFRLAYLAEKYQFTIDCSPGLRIVFDRHHFRQVMNNLCSNALRHALKRSPQNARIHVKVTAKSATTAVVAVLDNGGGVEATQQQHLFEPFFTNEHKGTGLGLYLCRELCEANQARIDYQSVATGACFYITLTSNKKKGAQ